MDSKSSSSKRPDDSNKKIQRYMKYTNLNSELDAKQKNRFKMLFSNDKEPYMFLLLRIMNVYAIYVNTNETLYNLNSDFRNYIFNYIFDAYFISQINHDSVQSNFFNDIDFTLEVNDENDIDLVNEEDDLTEEKIVYQPYDNPSFLRQFFDCHFARSGDYVYFKAFNFFSIDHLLPVNNYDEYLTFSIMNGSNNYIPYAGKYIRTICIDEKMKTFIDVAFNSYPLSNNPLNNQMSIINLKNQYWSLQRRKIFHNYLRNWGIKKIFQIDSHLKCTIHFNKIFYEWSKNNPSSITKLESKQQTLETTHFMSQAQQTRELSLLNDESNCLDLGFFPPKNRSPKPNPVLIKKYICYFTMNNTNVLDNLALDFVNSVIKQSFSHKNTVICGDYDKYYKWVNLFNPIGICNTGLIAFYPNPLPIQTINLFNRSDNENENAIKYNAKNIDIVRSVHKHFLVSSTYELPTRFNKYVNHIDFPYGGEFYNYDPLSDIDRLEIVKLLLVHGWHLLNSTDKPKKSVTTPSIKVLFDHLENTDETRIPLNVLDQIYRIFIGDTKTMPELRKTLQEEGYEYKTMAIRKSDKEYLEVLRDQARDITYHDLDISPSDKQKAFSCKLNSEFWNAISPQRKKETEDKNAADFNEYLKELAEKYAPFFVKETPEDPINDDPSAGFVPPEKFKDKDLQ